MKTPVLLLASIPALAASGFPSTPDVANGLPWLRTRKILRTIWRAISPLLAFGLLAYAMVAPWRVLYFATEGGPSHIYGATVIRDLLFHHRHSIYSPIYTIQSGVLPNWTGSIMLILTEMVVGIRDAEKLFISVTLLIGFLGWHYAARARSGGRMFWTPLAVLLYQTWFIRMGFYNFLLGMALLPFLVGYLVQNIGALDRRRSIAVASGLVALFFTHIMAAAAGVIAVLVLGCWVILMPALIGGLRKGVWGRLGGLFAIVLPVLLLAGVYASGEGKTVNFDSRVAWAWHEFPMHVFLTGATQAPRPPAMWGFLLGFAAIAALLLRKSEWLSAPGGMLAATMVIFAAYLLAPDMGIGGSLVKIRFSWMVFIFAGLLAYSASRLRFLHVPIAVYLAYLVWGNFVSADATSRKLSDTARAYLSVTTAIPPGSSFVRVRYPTPDLPRRYGFEGIGSEPLFHLDGLLAALKKARDLTDYEALSRTFPLVYRRSSVDHDQRYALWGLEGADNESEKMITWLDQGLPVHIGYVILLGDDSIATSQEGMRKVEQLPGSELVTSSPDRLIRLYRLSYSVPQR